MTYNDDTSIVVNCPKCGRVKWANSGCQYCDFISRTAKRDSKPPEDEPGTKPITKCRKNA